MHYQSAREIYEAMHHERGLMECHSGLGAAFAMMSDIPSAIEHHEKALKLSRELGEQGMECVCLSNLGGVYIGMNRQQDAKSCLSSCVTLTRGLGQFGALSSALTMLGKCESPGSDVSIELHTEAIAVAQEAKEIRCEANACSDLVNALWHAERFDEALEQLERSPVAEGAAYAMQLLGRGNLLISHPDGPKFDMALKSFTRAAEIHRADGDKQREAINLMNAGTCLYFLGRDAESVHTLEVAAMRFDAIWEGLTTDLDRIRHGDSIAPQVAQKLQWVHFCAGRHENALLWAERARARSLELLLARQRQSSDGQPVMQTPTASSNAPDFRAVACRQEVAIILYSVLDRCGFADGPIILIFVVDQSGGLHCQAVTDETDQSAISQLVALVSAGNKRDPASAPPLLRCCYDLLLSPISHIVDTQSKLLIIPDGQLFFLPFAALTDAGGQPLIAKHSIRLAPSITTLAELEMRAISRGTAEPCTALVVGGPDYTTWAFSDGRQLSLLKGAMQESKIVRNALEESTLYYEDTTHLDRKKATKKAVLEQVEDVHLLHLAAHGQSDGIYLAATATGTSSGLPSEAAGLIRMSEIQRLELKARLVVLSHCDSFRGTLSSDGVLGLSRAFMAAGALTVVASLWPVEDIMTQELMKHFYANLFTQTHTDPAQAMRQAMLTVLEAGSGDYIEWASFVVYGLGDVETSEHDVPDVSMDDTAPHLPSKTRTGGNVDEAEEDIRLAVTGPESIPKQLATRTVKILIWAMLRSKNEVRWFFCELEEMKKRGDAEHGFEVAAVGRDVRKISTSLEVDGCAVEPRFSRIRWSRRLSKASHMVRVPFDFPHSELNCHATAWIAGSGDRELLSESFIIPITQSASVSQANIVAADADLLQQVASLQTQVAALQAWSSVPPEIERAVLCIGVAIELSLGSPTPPGWTMMPSFDTETAKVFIIGQGSGWFFDSRGLLLTCEHVRRACARCCIKHATRKPKLVVCPFLGTQLDWNAHAWTAEVMVHTGVGSWDGSIDPADPPPDLEGQNIGGNADCAVLRVRRHYVTSTPVDQHVQLPNAAVPIATLAVGDPAVLVGGEQLYVLGYPSNGGRLTPTPTAARYGYEDQDIDGRWLKLQGLMMAGHSGGPVVARFRTSDPAGSSQQAVQYGMVV